MKVSPLHVDVIPGPSIVKSETNFVQHQHCRGHGFKSLSEPEFFSGLCSSSVMAALALMTVITQLLLMDKINFTLCYTWANFICPHIKGYPAYYRSHVVLIAQLGKNCTGIAEVVGLNPAQSLNFFQVSVLVVLRLHLH